MGNVTKDFAPSKSRVGGAREGAGRKPAGYEKPAEKLDFDLARARKENARADLNELDFKVKSGLYVSRAAVMQASATAFASVAQSLRSLPDTLERRFAMDPDVTAEVSKVIDGVLDNLADELSMLCGEDVA